MNCGDSRVFIYLIDFAAFKLTVDFLIDIIEQRVDIFKILLSGAVIVNLDVNDRIKNKISFRYRLNHLSLSLLFVGA
ncbi:hypothetical protein D3C78_1593240 [compost metagenome]